MDYETILVNKSKGSITIMLNRLAQKNSIDRTMLKEINQALDNAEKDPSCTMIIIEGQNGVFCTGMDFKDSFAEEGSNDFSSLYMETIKRFTMMPKVIIANVDGRVIAGGVGLAAASDFVIASPRSQFSLSEALWGLLPACVTPFLIRRVGFQVAYRMTLTTMPISAKEAYNVQLVDEMSESPLESIRRIKLRIAHIDKTTLRSMKQYFRDMWILTEDMEKRATEELSRLKSLPKVRENVLNYLNYQQFPWEGAKNSHND
ncbi:MAG: enoyl-CoA hydratase-related protein [bacterium]